MSKRRTIYCCACGQDVEARLTDGGEIYPHRPDLRSLPFWRCDTCGNYVGCHHKTKARINPLGHIPTPQIKAARKHVHALIDPVWKSRRMKRGVIYKAISDAVGWDYHTGKIRTIEEAREVYRAAKRLLAPSNITTKDIASSDVS